MTDEELRQLALGVVKALDGPDATWTYGMNDAGWGFDLVSSQDDHLTLASGRKAGTVHVRGWYPATRKTTETFERTMAATRGAAAIARDIELHVLPGYRGEVLTVAEFEVRRRLDHQARTSFVNEVEALFGARTVFPSYAPAPLGGPDQTTTTASLPVRSRSADRDYLTETARVTVRGGARRASLEVTDVPPEVVLRMARVLADYTATLPAGGS